MSSSGVPPNPTSHNIASMLPKLSDADPDIRYMTLNDLTTMLTTGHPTFLQHDVQTSCRIVDGLLTTLTDSNGDVQNQAIKALGPLVNKIPAEIMCATIEKVSTVKVGDGVDKSVPALATRAIVVALPHPIPGVARGPKVAEAYTAVSRALIPRLVGKVVVPLPRGASGNKLPAPPKAMLEADMQTGDDSNTLDLLTEVARCYGPMLQEVEVEALEQITMAVLQSDRCGTVMKKKAVAALSALSGYFSEALLAKHVSYTIEQLRQPHLTAQERKMYITIYGSLARSIPQKFGPYLKTLAPFVVSPLSQEELEQQQEQEAENDGERDTEMEEVREAALTAIESFLEACAQDMRAYTKEVIESSTRFLKYNPNVAEDDDEDMEEEEDDEFAGDEDFEEETGFEDEDDVSWKVRRGAAKALRAVVGVMSHNDPAVYGQIAPALIACFKEKEESVRNEIVHTLAYLISKTGPVADRRRDSIAGQHIVLPSRKRRRGGSDAVGPEFHAQQASMNGYASPTTPPPTDSAAQSLAKLNPEIVSGASKLLKTSTPSTKQAAMSLLKDMVSAQQGGLSDHADLVIDPLLDALHVPAGAVSSNNAGSHALRIEALALLRVIAETHSSKVLQQHLNKTTPALAVAAKDRYAKVSGEAFSTIEIFVKALTPPRSAASKSENSQYLKQLYDVITTRISAQDTDTEVRHKAVHALGLLIGRTSGAAGSKLLKSEDRFVGQQLLLERMRNELTRLPCVRAVETIAMLAQRKTDFKDGFVSEATQKLGAQLRKASRSLRSASLNALKMLSINQASKECLDDNSAKYIVEHLLPLLNVDDLQMLGPALNILASIAKDRPALVATKDVIDRICVIVTASLTGVTIDSLLTFVETMGQVGAGQELMKALLTVGTQGNTEITGQVVGTLLVSSHGNVGVELDDFVREAQNQKEEAKRCLALSVLGEAALRMGAECPLQSQSFAAYFDDPSEKVKLAAAVALGRAGAGNVKTYLPNILDAMSSGKAYLLLHSVKELLQHSNAEDDIRPYTKPLWDNIVNSGQGEDNKVVGAECIGRLAIIDAPAYLPQLQTFLDNPNPTIRGMVIQALRYTFSDTEAAYNHHLSPTIVPMLSTMLTDTDLENQRLALSTFNSAVHNKPDLVLPSLASDLLPHAMRATHSRPELIREVTMGPFKHRVDDGLEVRKTAYETLYSLLESPASRAHLDVAAFYDRIIAGLSDEHEIKILCCLVLSKLLPLYPAESLKRLEALAEKFRAVLAFKPKENAVKQELEKLAEQHKAVVKTGVLFQRAEGGMVTVEGVGEQRGWREFWEWVRKEFPFLVRGVEDEVRSGV
ncbi:hypothetical protein MBLNU230_g6539t1 [Neophaeotheca triangularis]